MNVVVGSPGLDSNPTGGVQSSTIEVRLYMLLQESCVGTVFHTPNLQNKWLQEAGKSIDRDDVMMNEQATNFLFCATPTEIPHESLPSFGGTRSEMMRDGGSSSAS